MRHRRSPRSFLPRRSSPLLPAIALLIVSSGVDVAWGSSGCFLSSEPDDDEKEEDAASRSWRNRLERHLRAMSAGTMEDRLEAIADAGELLDLDGDEDEEDPANPTPGEIADRWIDFIDSEPDEWMSWNLLDTLEYDEGEVVQAVFLAALSSSSPTLRAKALTFYTLEEDPAATPRLEALWDDGVPEWALPDLMVALAGQGSTTYLPDFLERTDDPDARVRLAAIEALADLQDDAALPRLLELARSDDRLARGAAIDALGDWNDSEQAVHALVEAIRSDPVWGTRALQALKKLSGPVRDEKLLEILADPEAQDWWVDAATGLEDSTLSRTDAALVEALETAANQDLQEVVTGLLAVLHNRDEVAALPGLLNLDPRIGGGTFLNLRRLIGYLERDRSSARTWRIAIRPRRNDESSEDEGSEPLFHVIAEGAAKSVRCWQGPDVAFGSWLEPRVPESERVTISSYFDREAETWAQLAIGCWIPLRLLADGAGPGPGSPDPRRREVDVPSDALHTSTARELTDAGLIEILDEEDAAAGIAVNLMDDGPAFLEVLALLKSATRRSVEKQMEDLLAAVEQEEELNARAAQGKGIVADR